ncbi:hypothetical protein [Numidum massiliense]|uniref:hypothetical protein n=1 Tax=Numidum massiliense TaxID=1522315 RepID=UPI0012F960D3|nr:hypothetical protein [Numidum massiliense]
MKKKGQIKKEADEPDSFLLLLLVKSNHTWHAPPNVTVSGTVNAEGAAKLQW